MTHRQRLIAALRDAAEVEHSITCLYLFAAFSLKSHPSEGGVSWSQLERVRHWKAELLGVAREEMMHHGLVLNLLNLVGGAPYFRRSSFPGPCRYTPPFETLELLPFSIEAIERFARYEELHSPSAEPAGASEGLSIGALYQRIRDGLERAEKHQPRLFVGAVDHQLSNAELKLRPRQFDIDLRKAGDLRSAQMLITSIVEEHDHFERMRAIHAEVQEMVRRDPHFAPARPVVTNPGVCNAPGVTDITHPQARAAAELFDAAYELMIHLLSRIYGRADDSPQEIAELVRVAFFPLMTGVIRPLGELLTHMPIARGEPSARAGAPFALPSGLVLPADKYSSRVVLHEGLLQTAHDAAALVGELERAEESWAVPLIDRFQLLRENLERLAKNFETAFDLKRAHVRHMMDRAL